MKNGLKTFLIASLILGAALSLNAQSRLAPKRIPADSLPAFQLNLNVLGVLQYGPILQGEFRVSRTGYLTTHVRIPYLGLIYQLDNVDISSDYVRVSPLALGIGAGYKTLFPGARGNWYIGSAAEYSFGSATGGDPYEWKSVYSHVALMTNGGYRWRMRNPHKTLSVGAYAGIYSSVTDHWWYTKNPGATHEQGGTNALIMAELSFGWGR